MKTSVLLFLGIFLNGCTSWVSTQSIIPISTAEYLSSPSKEDVLTDTDGYLLPPKGYILLFHDAQEVYPHIYIVDDSGETLDEIPCTMKNQKDFPQCAQKESSFLFVKKEKPEQGFLLPVEVISRKN